MLFSDKVGPPPPAWKHAPAAAVRGSRRVTWRVGSIQSPNKFHVILKWNAWKIFKIPFGSEYACPEAFRGVIFSNFLPKGCDSDYCFADYRHESMSNGDLQGCRFHGNLMGIYANGFFFASTQEAPRASAQAAKSWK